MKITSHMITIIRFELRRTKNLSNTKLQPSALVNNKVSKELHSDCQRIGLYAG